MYCIECGAENVEGTAHCIRCGHSLASLRTDNFTKPAIDPSSPTLWNPDVAALLSIPFTPAFGAIVHALNWRRLQQPRRAVVAWLWAGLVLLALFGVAIYGGAAKLSERTIDAYSGVTQLATLVLWYFGAARAQGKYIAGQLRNEYFRESWGIPVGVAIVVVGSVYGLVGWLGEG